MELVRWNPWGGMFNFRNRFNNLFDDSCYPAILRHHGSLMRDWNPVVDIYEEDDKVVVKAELPGVDKKDIAIDVDGRVLTIKGERSTDNEVKENHYYRRESSSGKFSRSFTLPADVKTEDIKADYKDGVLKIDIPKPEEEKPKQITIH